MTEWRQLIRSWWDHWFHPHVWQALTDWGHVEARAPAWKAQWFPRRAFGFKPTGKPHRLIMVRGCRRYYDELRSIRASLKNPDVEWSDWN